MHDVDHDGQHMGRARPQCPGGGHVLHGGLEGEIAAGKGGIREQGCVSLVGMTPFLPPHIEGKGSQAEDGEEEEVTSHFEQVVCTPTAIAKFRLHWARQKCLFVVYQRIAWRI